MRGFGEYRRELVDLAARSLPPAGPDVEPGVAAARLLLGPDAALPAALLLADAAHALAAFVG